MSKHDFEMAAAKKRRKIATVRYILPFTYALILLILFSLPVIYFKDYNLIPTERSSIFSRIFENITRAREVLYSSKATVDASHESFYSFVLTGAIVALICFAIGFIIAFLYMLAGLSFLSDNKKTDSQFRRVFITFVPDWIAVILLSAFCIVPSFFPYFLVKMLDRIMMVYSKPFITGYLLLSCICLLVAVMIFYAFTNKYNTDEVNIFAKPKHVEIERKEDDDEIYKDDTELSMEEKVRREQTEAIRKLLNKNNMEK